MLCYENEFPAHGHALLITECLPCIHILYTLVFVLVITNKHSTRIGKYYYNGTCMWGVMRARASGRSTPLPNRPYCTSTCSILFMRLFYSILSLSLKRSLIYFNINFECHTRTQTHVRKQWRTDGHIHAACVSFGGRPRVGARSTNTTRTARCRERVNTGRKKIKKQQWSRLEVRALKKKLRCEKCWDMHLNVRRW